jgi:hypothetical protein
MFRRSIASMFVLAAIAAVAFANWAHTADEITTRLLAACADMSDPGLRATCNDRVMSTSASTQAVDPKTSAGAVSAPSATALSPGLPQKDLAKDYIIQPAQIQSRPLTSQFGQESLPPAKRPDIQRNSVDSISAIIVALRRNGFGKTRVCLDNGQVWSQTENEFMQIKVGDNVVIRKGLLGAYFLVPSDLRREFRVMRIK